MLLVDPITGGIVETFTYESTKRLMAHGFKPVDEKKPTRKRTTRKKEQ